MVWKTEWTDFCPREETWCVGMLGVPNDNDFNELAEAPSPAGCLDEDQQVT
jgi:hypothetical protein